MNAVQNPSTLPTSDTPYRCFCGRELVLVAHFSTPARCECGITTTYPDGLPFDFSRRNRKRAETINPKPISEPLPETPNTARFPQPVPQVPTAAEGVVATPSAQHSEWYFSRRANAYLCERCYLGTNFKQLYEKCALPLPDVFEDTCCESCGAAPCTACGRGALFTRYCATCDGRCRSCDGLGEEAADPNHEVNGTRCGECHGTGRRAS